jgi:L-ribulose-5-phosphate 4-epimerase
MGVVDVAGRVVEGRLKPSVDTATHLYIYRERSDVFGVVHTHSNYATAFAAVGRPIPCALTAIADEFGGGIPVGDYAQIGEEEIGREVCRAIGAGKAILMKQHGVFTIGDSPEAALKAAVMVEDVAHTCFLALQLGALEDLPPEEIARAHKRYTEKYGQK